MLYRELPQDGRTVPSLTFLFTRSLVPTDGTTVSEGIVAVHAGFVGFVHLKKGL